VRERGRKELKIPRLVGGELQFQITGLRELPPPLKSHAIHPGYSTGYSAHNFKKNLKK